MSYPTLLLTL